MSSQEVHRLNALFDDPSFTEAYDVFSSSPADTNGGDLNEWLRLIHSDMCWASERLEIGLYNELVARSAKNTHEQEDRVWRSKQEHHTESPVPARSQVTAAAAAKLSSQYLELQVQHFPLKHGERDIGTGLGWLSDLQAFRDTLKNYSALCRLRMATTDLKAKSKGFAQASPSPEAPIEVAYEIMDLCHVVTGCFDSLSSWKADVDNDDIDHRFEHPRTTDKTAAALSFLDETLQQIQEAPDLEIGSDSPKLHSLHFTWLDAFMRVNVALSHLIASSQGPEFEEQLPTPEGESWALSSSTTSSTSRR